MASSGWQNEQTLHNFNSNVAIIGNIYVGSITHSGSNLRVTGRVALGARGTSGYYCYYVNGITEVPANGGSVKILGNNERLYVSDGDRHADFDVTIPNVAATATSYSFPVRFRAWYNSDSSTYWDVTKYWTITFDQGGSAPTGGYLTYNSSTWNSVTFTTGVSSTGGLTILNHAAVLTGSSNGAAASATDLSTGRWEWLYDGTMDTSHKFVATQATSGQNFDNPIAMKGLLNYKLGYWIENTAGSIWGVENTLRYLPPAPLQSIAYTQTQNSTNVTVNLTITGGSSANNYSDTVTTYWRYSTNGGSTYSAWASAGTGTPWTAKTATFNCNYQAAVVVQAKQTYHGMDSEIKQISFTATSGTAPSGGSVVVDSATWNTITLTASGVNYGKPDSISGRKLAIGVGNGPTTRAYKRENQPANVTGATTTVTNSSIYPGAQPLDLKGMLPVYPYVWAWNTITSAMVVDNQPVYYLPPAPGQFTYTDPGTIGTKTYPVSFTGVAANNYSGYDASQLTRTVRYKVGNGPWVDVEAAAIKTLDAVTIFNVTIPAGMVATIEGYMTYRGKNSETSTVYISNTNAPVAFYGSVNSGTKKIVKFYGSVNGVTKKVDKIYGSLGGVTREFYEDV